jgi:uncharacterized protein (DUF1684 family)
MDFQLLDYRRKVFELYRIIRQIGLSSPVSFTLFKETRDNLFKNHSQSPLNEKQREEFRRLCYYDYNNEFRTRALFTDFGENTVRVQAGDIELTQIGKVTFRLKEEEQSLGVYRHPGPGEIFIPFRDVTSGVSTYSGGRFLYDTAEGADLGTTITRNGAVSFFLDFNYSYNPSYYYNEKRFGSQVPMEQNTLSVAIEAGERLMVHFNNFQFNFQSANTTTTIPTNTTTSTVTTTDTKSTTTNKIGRYEEH